jgi:hypothetical protein
MLKSKENEATQRPRNDRKAGGGLNKVVSHHYEANLPAVRDQASPLVNAA